MFCYGVAEHLIRIYNKQSRTDCILWNKKVQRKHSLQGKQAASDSCLCYKADQNVIAIKTFLEHHENKNRCNINGDSYVCSLKTNEQFVLHIVK